MNVRFEDLFSLDPMRFEAVIRFMMQLPSEFNQNDIFKIQFDEDNRCIEVSVVRENR